MKTREKMDILASAIRSRARKIGKDPRELSNIEINRLADAQYQEEPETVAAKFYADENACSEWHWKRVCGMVRG